MSREGEREQWWMILFGIKLEILGVLEVWQEEEGYDGGKG